ncbi:ArnT family glycosyltransferase [Polluticoccus soli]|uniref:ArnT family glycosyltransferase n=1 Tax=Polluticoccus soli TaxID=3034150 RepID=UPI0023E285FF|nr:glycosyltransferase family 39 protein [Flavipsychrobacter sp. JY13-12]
MNNLSRDTLLGAIAVLLIAAYPVFGNLAYLPVQLWDESRLAMNAFEMNRSGEWLVTTFDGEPDLWNTKPPLMIWLQVLCIKLHGLNELSLRIPSAAATLLTLGILYWFTAVKKKSPLLGVITCLVLITSPGYTGLHRTRSGDYDALLVLFTTAHWIYMYLYAEEKKRPWFYLSLLCLIAGAMTKGVAALICLPAMFIYFAVTKQLGYILKQRDVYIGIAAFVLSIGGYYLLREWRMQGYLNAVAFNDVTGRFGDPSTAEGNDYLYYARYILKGNFSYWALVLPFTLIYLVVTKNKETKRLGLYTLLLGCFYFIVISISRTKNTWYDMAVYPLWSLAAALAITHAIEWIADRSRYPIPSKILVTAAIVIVSHAHILNHIQKIDKEIYRDDYIGFFMKDILHHGNKHGDFAVVWNSYHANLYWYLKILRHQGREVKTAVYQDLKPGMRIASFEEEVQKYIESHYKYRITGQVEAVRFYKIMD